MNYTNEWSQRNREYLYLVSAVGGLQSQNLLTIQMFKLYRFLSQIYIQHIYNITKLHFYKIFP